MPSIEEIGVETPSPVKVLVIGACYAGLAAGLNLLDLCSGKPSRFSPPSEDGAELEFKTRTSFSVKIKFVDERDGYYHLIGSPLALASRDFASKAWIKFDDIPALRVPEVSWVRGSVIRVDCERKVALIGDANTGLELEESYDYLVASSGLRRAWPVVPQSLRKEIYLNEVNAHINEVENAREGVVIIGGGAVGIEMAAELKLIIPHLAVTLIHSRNKLLSSEPLPDDFKDQTLALLRETGVRVILNDRVNKVQRIDTADSSPLFELTLRDGSTVFTSHVIWAISKSFPSTSYLPRAVLDPDGYVKIGPSLNFTMDIANARQHFAVGDIAAWSGIKRCSAAMYMGHGAAVNIHQQMLQKHGKKPKFFELPEVPPMIAIAIGKRAIMYSPQEGTKWGEDCMEMMFADDLGFSICWNYLQLSAGPTGG